MPEFHGNSIQIIITKLNLTKLEIDDWLNQNGKA